MKRKILSKIKNQIKSLVVFVNIKPCLVFTIIDRLLSWIINWFPFCFSCYRKNFPYI